MQLLGSCAEPVGEQGRDGSQVASVRSLGVRRPFQGLAGHEEVLEQRREAGAGLGERQAVVGRRWSQVSRAGWVLRVPVLVLVHYQGSLAQVMHNDAYASKRQTEPACPLGEAQAYGRRDDLDARLPTLVDARTRPGPLTLQAYSGLRVRSLCRYLP